MEFNIAIIDDDTLFSSDLKTIIFEQMFFFDIKDYSIDSFINHKELLESINKYQCVFLDIEMPGINGLELARIIRKKRKDIYIVFISSFTNYVFQSFDVQPFTYIVKNEIQKRGKDEIYRLIKHFYENEKKYYLKVGKIEYKLKQKDISLIEKQGNDCLFYYNNERIKTRCNIKSLIAELANYFILVNKSEIINFYFVKSIRNDEIILKDGTVHFISRRKIKTVIESYFSFLKDKPSDAQ